MATGTIQKNRVLLWENPNPTSEFAAQTVSVDLSEYNYAWVEVSASTSYGTDAQVFINPIPGHLFIFTTWLGNYIPPISERHGSITSNGITFTDCMQKNANSNSAPTKHNVDLIPCRIYGLKV